MRIARRILGLILLLALAWTGLVLSEWLPLRTSAQQTALDLLERDPQRARGERDAYPLLWLFNYDLPEAELGAVLQADVQRFADQIQRRVVAVDYLSSAEGKYPAIPMPPGNDPRLCQPWNDDCLQRVRADVAGTRARLAEFALRLQRGDLLRQYDHARYPFEPRFDSPVGGVAQLYPLQLTAAALAYVDGDVAGAFDRLCRDSATWRRLRARSDMLIQDMIGVAQMSNAAQLYAQILAEQPADFAAPCTEVFAALSDDELDQCAVFRMEYLVWRNSMPQAIEGGVIGQGGVAGKLVSRLVNSRHVIDRFAEPIAYYCSDAQHQRVHARQVEPGPQISFCSGASEWLFDPLGCFLIEEATPAYDPYFQRVLDLDGRMRLMQALIWLRTQPGDPAQAFEQRPDSLRSPAHAMRLQEGKLGLMNLDQARSAWWEIPYRVAAAPAGG